jgi:hypothetical protein
MGEGLSRWMRAVEGFSPLKIVGMPIGSVRAHVGAADSFSRRAGRPSPSPRLSPEYRGEGVHHSFPICFRIPSASFAEADFGYASTSSFSFARALLYRRLFT